jgi:RimJ/RimL family protein N-acetyltransferase
MKICGEKVVLRAIESDDNALLLSLINDPDTEMMLGGGSWPVSEAEQLKWFERLESSKNILRCIIAVAEDNSAVGTVILSDIDQKNGIGHIHIKMSKEGRGKGYATDAVNTLVRYAFNELRLHCIYANILEYNEASVRLFEKCHFKRDGILRARVFKNGKYIDMYAYSRLPEDYEDL